MILLLLCLLLLVDLEYFSNPTLLSVSPLSPRYFVSLSLSLLFHLRLTSCYFAWQMFLLGTTSPRDWHSLLPPDDDKSLSSSPSSSSFHWPNSILICHVTMDASNLIKICIFTWILLHTFHLHCLHTFFFIFLASSSLSVFYYWSYQLPL